MRVSEASAVCYIVYAVWQYILHYVRRPDRRDNCACVKVPRMCYMLYITVKIYYVATCVGMFGRRQEHARARPVMTLCFTRVRTTCDVRRFFFWRNFANINGAAASAALGTHNDADDWWRQWRGCVQHMRYVSHTSVCSVPAAMAMVHVGLSLVIVDEARTVRA